MDDALDMSLDDYINSFKQSKSNIQPPNGLSHKEESKFKEGRREREDNEDEEDDELILQCQEDDYVSLALKNDESMETIQTDQNDLRNKIVGRFPNSNSQQWRLMQPNVMHSRPAGMPPLIPSGMTQNGLSGNRGNWRNYNNRYRNSGRQNWNNNNYNNNNNNGNNRYNGRIQRFNNTKANLNSKNIKIVLQQLKERNPMIFFSDGGSPDLTIEATTNEQERSNGIMNLTMPMQIKSNLPPVAAGKPESSVQPKASEAIKSLLGVNEVSLRNDMMPALAGKLLDFLNGVNPTVHKPIYDMKIQKEIHDIQKKPLLYKCPGGEVVSSDGAGIPNCRIQPKASGLSLNNRFA